MIRKQVEWLGKRNEGKMHELVFISCVFCQPLSHVFVCIVSFNLHRNLRRLTCPFYTNQDIRSVAESEC